MSVRIAYNNTPSLVLLCENRVKLEPAGMLKDHAELTEEQQNDPAVVSWTAQGKILLLNMDEAAKRENRRQKEAVVPEPTPKVSVKNPATPVPAPVAKKAEEPEKAPEPKSEPAKAAEIAPEPEAEDDSGDDDDTTDAKGKGKKSKKFRRG